MLVVGENNMGIKITVCKFGTKFKTLHQRYLINYHVNKGKQEFHTTEKIKLENFWLLATFEK